MKKLLLLSVFILLQLAINANSRIRINENSSVVIKKEDCGSYKGKKLYKGPRGGCYYINKNGNKTYVDRTYCNC